MDCEKFDQHVIDALYGELDELTQAGLERHVEGCSRCGPVYAGLKATRAVAILPLEEPPADLEARILAASDLQIGSPWRRRVARALAWTVTSQIAAAAVFLLVIGSGVAVFRTRSASSNRAVAPAAVAADQDVERKAPAATAAAPAPSPEPDLLPRVAAERPADTADVGGESPVATASAAATAVAAASASAPAPGERTKAAEAQVVARGGDAATPPLKAAAQKPPAVKPARPLGGTNPRAPAAPRYNDAYH